MPSSSSRFRKLAFLPGFHTESTEYSEEGKWYEGDKVRFRNGRPENMRGYEKKDTTALIGTPRAIRSWANNNTEKLLSTATEQRLSIYYNGYNYDVSPIVSTVSIEAGVNGDFSTSIGSGQIDVSLTNHGVSVKDWLFFTSASVNGFGGATNFAASSFGGPTFQVVAKADLNHFTISVTSVADSTASNMGNATMNYLPSTQQTTNIQGLGYGAGVYNAGASTTGVRAWDIAASSSNIIFLANQWSLDTWGEDLLAVRRGGPLFHWDANASVSPERATVVATGPSQINSIVVSPNDRHVLALGTNEYATSVFNPLLIRWSDQEDYTNWTPAISTTSGELKLAEGTEIVGGIRARNVIHVWTDKTLYGVQYVGPPFIFSISQLGTHCGLVGPHAAAAVDESTYWMGHHGFHMFNGRCMKLPCTVQRHIFDNFNMSQGDKVFAGVNAEFHEVIWLYPSNDALEPDSYVIYNTKEDHWVFGSTNFNTFENAFVFNNTITTGNISDSYYMLNNEPVSVYTANGQAVTSYLKSADFDIEEGDKIMFMSRIIPDFDISHGNLEFTIEAKEYPTGTTITKGPYTINSSTKKIDFRSRGRQAAVRVSSSDSGVSWRYGSIRLAIQPDGER